MLAEGDVGRSCGAEPAACGCLRADPLREVRGAAGARDRGEERDTCGAADARGRPQDQAL